MMKKVDLANAGLLMLIPLTMIGFSASIHAHNSDISTTKAAEVNKIGETIDTEYSGNTELNQGKMRPLYFQASRVFSVKYRTVNFKTVLDEDYKEEKLYRYVPGAKKTIGPIAGKRLRPIPARKCMLIKKPKHTTAMMMVNGKVKTFTGFAYQQRRPPIVTGSMKMQLMIKMRLMANKICRRPHFFMRYGKL